MELIDNGLGQKGSFLRQSCFEANHQKKTYQNQMLCVHAQPTLDILEDDRVLKPIFQ